MKATKEVREILLDLYARHGELTAELVVTVATDPTSPLHSLFEWDDSAAAEKYRLTQGAQLIRSVRVRIERGDEEASFRVPAFLNVRPSPAPASYVAVNDALADPERRGIVLARARQELITFRTKYQNLVELSNLVAEIFGDLGEGEAATG